MTPQRWYFQNGDVISFKPDTMQFTFNGHVLEDWDVVVFVDYGVTMVVDSLQQLRDANRRAAVAMRDFASAMQREPSKANSKAWVAMNEAHIHRYRRNK